MGCSPAQCLFLRDIPMLTVIIFQNLISILYVNDGVIKYYMIKENN